MKKIKILYYFFTIPRNQFYYFITLSCSKIFLLSKNQNYRIKRFRCNQVKYFFIFLSQIEQISCFVGNAYFPCAYLYFIRNTIEHCRFVRCCDAAFAAVNFVGCNEETFVVDSIVETSTGKQSLSPLTRRCRKNSFTVSINPPTKHSRGSDYSYKSNLYFRGTTKISTFFIQISNKN